MTAWRWMLLWCGFPTFHSESSDINIGIFSSCDLNCNISVVLYTSCCHISEMDCSKYVSIIAQPGTNAWFIREKSIYSRQISKLSSVPSSQSGSPSQCHRFGTHWPFWHTKSASAHVFLTAVGEKREWFIKIEEERERCVSVSLIWEVFMKPKQRVRFRKGEKNNGMLAPLVNSNCITTNITASLFITWKGQKFTICCLSKQSPQSTFASRMHLRFDCCIYFLSKGWRWKNTSTKCVSLKHAVEIPAFHYGHGRWTQD